MAELDAAESKEPKTEHGKMVAEVDAAESKKPKTKHGKMAEEACLCLVTELEFYAIKMRNLEKQEDDVHKDWTFLPEFVLKLSERDLCPFEFDSKIFMAYNGLLHFGPSAKSGYMKDLRPFPIYEFKFEEKETVVAESLDPAPLPLYSSFIANTPGSGDVFFHIDQRGRIEDSPLFYVLESGSRIWKPLISPPSIGNVKLSMFVLHNNLFVSSFVGDPYLARFDPIDKSWKVQPSSKNNLSNFLRDSIIGSDESTEFRWIYYPLISVTIPGWDSSNYTICMTYEEFAGPPKNPGVNVVAILVNHHNGRVAFYQRLYVCFQGIQPVMYGESRFNLVDLGNGKLCATLCGRQLASTSSTLCVSIFSLSVAKDFADFAELDSGASPMERDFLQVDVHTKNVYEIKDWNMCDSVQHAFVWPPIKGGRFQHRTLA
ncbi:hypothetical protein PIB30_047138 [Stylosanthes scabra]|uniref:Uncharacterized protein n=1 Tax=Stylosanthes scabra TaxID=79078 RepID=A0ABU6VHD7_9FABA|nr:hypothetical protein [Stylosanthes scabra]